MKQLEYVQKEEKILVNKESINTFAGLYVENLLRQFFGKKVFDPFEWCHALDWLIKSYGHGCGCGMATYNTCDAAFLDYEYSHKSDYLVLKIRMWKVVATEVKYKY